MFKPKEYGYGIGPFRPLETQTAIISLENGGVDKSKSAAQLVDAGSPNATDVRLIQGGGVSADYDYTAFGTPYGGADKPIIGLAPYELDSGTKFLMRCRPTGWDRWNGTNWLTLSGALTASVQDRIYASVQNQLFIVANGVDKLKKWDGVDGDAIADLSADAPVAFYITRIGTRLLAARVKVAGVLHPNYVAWSEDGNILGWTNTLNGAGSTDLLAEGSGRKANYITGLSTVQRGAVIYRQQSLQMALLTGVAAAPFRFSTVDFSHGTESPYSIASGGMETGDFFLGSDYMPYNFSGEAQPTPIGGPIHDELLRIVPSLKEVIGAIDTNEQDYWLGIPTVSGGPLTIAWVFNIREYAIKRRYVWRKRVLPPNTRSFGFGNVVSLADPIVNTVSSVVDTVGIRVNDFGITTGPERLMFGDDNGQVFYVDKSKATIVGSWESKQVQQQDAHNLQVDRTRLKYVSNTGGTVAVSISCDGGITYSPEKIATLVITGFGPQYVTVDHGVTGRSFMVRLRPTGGFGTISELQVTYQDKGIGNG